MISEELKEVVKKLKELKEIAIEHDNPTEDFDEAINGILSGFYFRAEIKANTEYKNYNCPDCKVTALNIEVNNMHALMGGGIHLIVCSKCGRVLVKFYMRS